MILKKENYTQYADCIRSDQVSAPEVAELFEDKKFREWYRNTYLLWDDPDNHEYE